MAKSEVFNDPVAAKVMELKKELQKLVKAIAVDDSDDFSVEALDKAHRVLCLLRDSKIKRSLSLKLNESPATVPEEFRCPLSKQLMRDPVIIASGQTYDRPFIQKWLKAGNRTCPRTQQVLSHTLLTPNHLIREMISQWCKNNGIEMPDPIQVSEDDAITEADRERFISLLSKMSSSISDQKDSARELRMLTKRMPSFRALFGETTEAIPKLISPLSPDKFKEGTNAELQEDIVTALLNLSIHDNNKKLVAETPTVIPILMGALKSGTIQTRSNAAAALFTLSALDSNKSLLGKWGALKPLIDLLDQGHELAMKDAASAIFNLCITQENKVIAVRDGIVKVILKKITDRMLVDELVTILAMFSNHPKAVEEMIEFEAVPCLFSIIRDTSSERTKENCIVILHTICVSDRTQRKEMREEELTYGTISHLGQHGTARAKRKANAILDRLNKAINFTHTA
ncbi:OLC1v1006664C1 [Oldenlandia corymbosa var. corymbosa]|uniref:RING-type E3 ubiquitin transferase n=1 Tax=Oldenlandia corymbosa var. corymbosa TaxID=529605 RepID=A0AAV1DHJ7_OLDCO|nr:OLC1v1006664C1 [Oldenlandia corymbosa var. corymbosa]